MTKYVLRHIHGIKDYGREYNNKNKFMFFGYMNADYGVSLDDRLLIVRYVFFLGSGPISWDSNK